MAKRSTFDEPERMEEESGEDTVQKVKSAVNDTAEKAQEKVGEFGRSVQDKIDENRGPAADKLQDVASTLHEKADSLRWTPKVGQNLAVA